MRAGPHPRALSRSRSLALGPQALPIQQLVSIRDLPGTANRYWNSWGANSFK